MGWGKKFRRHTKKWWSRNKKLVGTVAAVATGGAALGAFGATAQSATLLTGGKVASTVGSALGIKSTGDAVGAVVALGGSGGGVESQVISEPVAITAPERIDSPAALLRDETVSGAQSPVLSQATDYDYLAKGESSKLPALGTIALLAALTMGA